MKTIWILSHYATNQYFNHGGRHYCFAKYLIREGYKVKIFCANTFHNSSEIMPVNSNGFVEKCVDGIPFVFVKARPYAGNGIQRILNMVDYYKHVKRIAKYFDKPDVVIGSSVHPLACVGAIKLSKRYKCKNIVEIRDLWPESIVAYDILGANNLIVKMLYKMEKWIYCKADNIVFTMEGGKDYIIEKKWDKAQGGKIDLNKVYHINNGVDLSMFEYNKEHFMVEDDDLNNDYTFKVVYTGSIRMVNDIGTLIDVARILRELSDKVVIIIYGKGSQLEELKNKSNKLGLNNIIFKGSVEKKYIPYILSKCDLNLMHGQKTILLEYGMSTNKSFDYLASGKPIYQNFIINYDYIASNGCGIANDVKNSEEYAKGILSFANMPSKKIREFQNSALSIVKKYDYKNLSNQLIELIVSQLD